VPKPPFATVCEHPAVPVEPLILIDPGALSSAASVALSYGMSLPANASVRHEEAFWPKPEPDSAFGWPLGELY
jgi:hypothetical protein